MKKIITNLNKMKINTIEDLISYNDIFKITKKLNGNFSVKLKSNYRDIKKLVNYLYDNCDQIINDTKNKYSINNENESFGGNNINFYKNLFYLNIFDQIVSIENDTELVIDFKNNTFTGKNFRILESNIIKPLDEYINCIQDTSNNNDTNFYRIDLSYISDSGKEYFTKHSKGFEHLLKDCKQGFSNDDDGFRFYGESNSGIATTLNTTNFSKQYDYAGEIFPENILQETDDKEILDDIKNKITNTISSEDEYFEMALNEDTTCLVETILEDDLCGYYLSGKVYLIGLEIKLSDAITDNIDYDNSNDEYYKLLKPILIPVDKFSDILSIGLTLEVDTIYKDNINKDKNVALVECLIKTKEDCYEDYGYFY